MPPKEYEIVDPLALILRPEIYVNLHLPDPPPDLRTKVQESIREMSAQDRQQALARVKALAYANVWIGGRDDELLSRFIATGAFCDPMQATLNASKVYRDTTKNSAVWL